MKSYAYQQVKISAGIGIVLYAWTVNAYGMTGLESLGSLVEAAVWLVFAILGLLTTMALALAFSSGYHRKNGYYGHIIAVIIFGLISIPWYIDPEVTLATAIVLLSSSCFVIALCYCELEGKKAHGVVTAYLLVALPVLLTNPTILSLNNYILSDEPPFTSELYVSELDEPMLRGFEEMFFKTSDGRVFFYETGSNAISYNPYYPKPIKLVKSSECPDPCYRVFGIQDYEYRLKKPTAILDFQSGGNFQGKRDKASSFINIPLKDRRIYRYSKKDSRLYRQAKSKNGVYLWDPLSYILWNEICDKRRYHRHLIDRLLEKGADPNYRPDSQSPTVFECDRK